MLIEQCAYFCRDLGVAGAAAEAAFPVGRASRKSADQKDGAGECA
jgi:hypothetical protein